MKDIEGVGAVEVRLDPYHQFVVKELAAAMEVSPSVIIGRMVQQWVSDHPAQVEQGEASLYAWLRIDKIPSKK